MAYDRYDPRDERSRWRDERYGDRARNENDRGFFERAGDEIASWFGDDDAERRRREDMRREDGEWNRDADRGRFSGRERGRFDREERRYRPVTGDYGRSDSFSAGRSPREFEPDFQNRESQYREPPAVVVGLVEVELRPRDDRLSVELAVQPGAQFLREGVGGRRTVLGIPCHSLLRRDGF